MEEKLNAYPLKFEPNLKTVIWGGGKIRKLKKLADAPDCIGESWELTGVPGQESVVSNGEYAGRDIKSLLGEFGAQVVGLNTYNKYGDMFPIMVKFIDAAKDLSIQVHPDDDFAKRRHQGMGKTELWYIVSAKTMQYSIQDSRIRQTRTRSAAISSIAMWWRSLTASVPVTATSSICRQAACTVSARATLSLRYSSRAT